MCPVVTVLKIHCAKRALITCALDIVCPMYVTDELRNVSLLNIYTKKNLSNSAGHASEATRLTVC